jgi:hypothetical protein
MVQDLAGHGGLVDERDELEPAGAAGVPERVREAEPAIHLGGLERGEGVRLGVGASGVLVGLPAFPDDPFDDPGEDLPEVLLGGRPQRHEAGGPVPCEVEDPVRDQGVEVAAVRGASAAP